MVLANILSRQVIRLINDIELVFKLIWSYSFSLSNTFWSLLLEIVMLRCVVGVVCWRVAIVYRICGMVFLRIALLRHVLDVLSQLVIFDGLCLTFGLWKSKLYDVCLMLCLGGAQLHAMFLTVCLGQLSFYKMFWRFDCSGVNRYHVASLPSSPKVTCPIRKK